jgi:hypothetical protein
MSYGKVISGGASMRKGLTKGVNDKLSGFAEENKRRAVSCWRCPQCFYRSSFV